MKAPCEIFSVASEFHGKMKNRGLKTGKKIGSKGRSGFFALEIREEDRRKSKKIEK